MMQAIRALKRTEAIKSHTGPPAELPTHACYADDASILLELPSDLMLHIVEQMGARPLERLRTLHSLMCVSSTMRSALKPARPHLAALAAKEIIHHGHERAETSQLLNLSGSRIGALECYLLAVALSRGWLSGTHTLWMQHNAIDARGLRYLARGLQRMPTGEGGELRSISLGANPFQTSLEDKHLQTSLAVNRLSEAAAKQGVCLRFRS